MVTPLRSIKLYCGECMNRRPCSKLVKECWHDGKAHEWTQGDIIAKCPLWEFRMGHGRGKGSYVRAIRRRCVDCAENATVIRECPCPECPLYPYRMGKTGKPCPSRRWTPARKAAAAARNRSLDAVAHENNEQMRAIGLGWVAEAK